MSYKRNRLLSGLMLILVIVFGLWSRKFSSILPVFLNIYLGDALWALMIFIGIGLVFRTMETRQVALAAISFCYLVELSQLYHADWIDNLRRTTIGGLILGYGFLWTDLLAYAVGIGFGMSIELLKLKKT